MCESNMTLKKGNLSIICKVSGKPISISNKNGMYCADMCNEDLDIKAGKKIKALIKGICESVGVDYEDF